MPILSGEDTMLPMSKSITSELQEQWTILSEVWGTPMAQWKGIAVAAWMEAAIGKKLKTTIIAFGESIDSARGKFGNSQMICQIHHKLLCTMCHFENEYVPSVYHFQGKQVVGELLLSMKIYNSTVY